MIKTRFKSIYKIVSITIIASSLVACEADDEAIDQVLVAPAVKSYEATINLTQMVNGNALQMNTADFPYSNTMNQNYKVTKLQYLISDITFHKANGSSFTIEEYHYVDLSNPSTSSFTPTTKIPEGNYASISFTFGFDEEDNITSQYADLNTIGWNWPFDPNSMFGDLGGGYHFMRLEGDYITSTGDTAQFKHHMGTARDASTTPFTYVANHFTAQPDNSSLLIDADFSFDIEMNIEEWYKSPIAWDFNVWNAPIMPIFDAQRALNSNGPTVFSIKIN